MDAVTYPDPRVRAELSRWVRRRVDVADDPGAAAAFDVVAIPTAVLLTPDGRVLDRVIGFVPPADFLRRLAAARTAR